MKFGDHWQRWMNNPIVEWTIFAVGALLMLVVAPLVGALPGPGGIFVFALGLAMVLKSSRWARRRYVEFKRWQPQAGRWTDWGLRRKSALRREAIAKTRKARAEQATTPGAESAIDPAAAPQSD